jgi:hypothetical protein
MIHPTDPAGEAFPWDNRTLDQDQARDTALAALQEMGLPHLRLTLTEENYILRYASAGQPGQTDPTGQTGEPGQPGKPGQTQPAKRPCYTFFFARDVAGVPDNFALPRPLTKKFTDILTENIGASGLFIEGSPALLSSETAVITVAPEGIIGFVWGKANTTLTVRNGYVALLPFEEIQNICRKQLLMNYDTLTIQLHGYRTVSPGNEPHLVIDKIKLGMMRVPRYGQAGESWVIPVWDFYGYDTHISVGLGTRGETASPTEGSRYVTKSPLNSYLTLNALDGSIINRNTGF